jgi:hypothetical protein
MILDGKPWTVSLIQNPTIDDVLVTEARLQAHNVEQGAVVTSDDRRVARDIRDYLIRFGVEH